MHYRRRQSGFNLLELMVTLFVAAIVMGVGIPAFNGFVANGRVATLANDLAASIHLARTEAVKQRANITICPSTEWDQASPTCTDSDFSDGWIMFIDSRPPNAPDLAHTGADDVIYVRGPTEGGLTLTVADQANVINTDQFLVFGTDGYPLLALGGNPAVFNFQICDHRGDTDTGGGIAAGRWIQLSPTGRPQVFREQAYVESAANPTNGC